MVDKPFSSLGDVEDITEDRKAFRARWERTLSTPKQGCYHEDDDERNCDCRRKQSHRKQDVQLQTSHFGRLKYSRRPFISWEALRTRSDIRM